jgi:sugar phosphate permease
VLFLLLRASLSSMDVPARQAYVVSVVPKEERAAAASVTNVPRSLASAIPPLVTGWFLERGASALPLFIAGGLKAAYDLLLLWRFARVHPLDEAERGATRTSSSRAS